MTDYKMEVETGLYNIKMSDKIDFKIKRGEESWKYIYTVLGFTLTIEGTVVSMIPVFWFNKILFVFVLFLVTFFLFIDSSRFQNKLILFKTKMEEKFK